MTRGFHAYVKVGDYVVASLSTATLESAQDWIEKKRAAGHLTVIVTIEEWCSDTRTVEEEVLTDGFPHPVLQEEDLRVETRP